MKLLEGVKLVQFFLYESEEFRTGPVTGFFGMNGAGKSALLDAVQIALFGGNGNLVSLNSKADDSAASVRTIRSYCLGQTTPDIASRVRDAATTYVTLVFRDTVTGEPTSLGVCITAHHGAPRHEVVGRYLMPGTELALVDHLDTVDGAPAPADWSVFRARLAKRFLGPAGETPFVNEAERFIKKALFTLRSEGAAIDDEAFKRALKFGLRMRFERASVDDVIRRHVLEDRRTDIAQFRKTSESFRDLLQLVNQVTERIKEARRIDAEYRKAEAELARLTAWQVSALDVEAERTNAELAAAEERHARAEEALDAVAEELKEVEGLESHIQQLHETVDGRRLAHASHQAAGAANAELTAAATQLTRALGDITGVHRLVERGLQALVAADALARQRVPLARDAAPARELLDAALRPRLQAALTELQRTHHALDRVVAEAQRASSADEVKALAEELDPVRTEALAALARAVALVAELEPTLRACADEAKEAVAEAETALKRAQESLVRLESGRAPLSDGPQRLKDALEAAGLSPVPVCDLVRVKDAVWQPVIESYLGPNREALMMPDAAEEAAAFDIYRGMKGAHAVYGAKIFGKQRQKPRDHAAESVAALLIGSDAAALAYLRGKFGGLMTAASRDEALGHYALTADGMLCQGSEFERLKPVAPADLKLGGVGASREQRASLEARVAHCRRALDDAKAFLKSFDAPLAALRPLTAHEVVLPRLKDDWTAVAGALARVRSALQQLASSAEASYVALVEEEKRLRFELKTLADKKGKLLSEHGAAGTVLEQAAAGVASAKRADEAAAAAAKAGREAPGFDHDLAAAAWDELLARFQGDYGAMAGHCRSQQTNRKNAADNAVRVATAGLVQFAIHHNEHPPVGYDSNWVAGRQWLTQRLQLLEDTELAQHQEEMHKAYEAARSTFRNDVAMKLGDNIKRMEKYIRTLNHALEQCPPFTNGERYRFRYRIKPEYQALLAFVQSVHDGVADEDLFGGAGEVPESFRALLEDKALVTSADTANPLDDYRYFFEFDVEIRRAGSAGTPDDDDPKRYIGVLSSRLRSGSGGEHTAPLYVMAGAALAAAYRLNAADRAKNGLALMLIDEAFLRMDDNNIAATMQYLTDLGLQVFVAGTGSNLAILTPFMHRYYDLARDEQTNTVYPSGHDVTAQARELASADLLEFHPELVQAETQRMLAALRERAAANTTAASAGAAQDAPTAAGE